MRAPREQPGNGHSTRVRTTRFTVLAHDLPYVVRPLLSSFANSWCAPHPAQETQNQPTAKHGARRCAVCPPMGGHRSSRRERGRLGRGWEMRVVSGGGRRRRRTHLKISFLIAARTESKSSRVWVCVYRYVCLCVGAAVWLCGCVAVWLCGCVAVRLCGCAAVWLCGCLAVWLCCCVVVWLCGCVVAVGAGLGRMSLVVRRFPLRAACHGCI